MSSYKKVACKGTLWQVFIRVYRLETSLVGIFDPSNLLSGSTLPPPSFPCVKVQFIQPVFGWEGAGGCWALFNTVYLTRFRTYKIARPNPKQKPRRGDGVSDR
jgi:hypothetical protein